MQHLLHHVSLAILTRQCSKIFQSGGECFLYYLPRETWMEVNELNARIYEKLKKKKKIKT